MSINLGTNLSKMTIYRDENGRYKTYIKSTDIDENGEKKDIFMSKKVQFRKDVHVRNKSVIEVTEGWLAPYRIKTKEKDSERKLKYKYFDKIFINEFKLLEDGIDEDQKVKQYQEQEQHEKVQEDFAFDSYSADDLPF